MRLLFVDDDALITRALADYFSGTGCEVDCADCVAAAIELLDALEYEAVVTDLRLSATGTPDGLDVVSHARRRQSACACIVLTADVDAEGVRRAEQRGADAVLQKPAPLPRVADLILRLLGQAADGGRQGLARGPGACGAPEG